MESRAASELAKAASSSILGGIVDGIASFLTGLAVFIAGVLVVAGVISGLVAAGVITVAGAKIIGLAVAIAGAVFLVASLAMNLYNRFAQSIKAHGWWTVVLAPWIVVVALGEVIGVTQLLEGVFNFDLVTGNTFTPRAARREDHRRPADAADAGPVQGARQAPRRAADPGSATPPAPARRHAAPARAADPRAPVEEPPVIEPPGTEPPIEEPPRTDPPGEEPPVEETPPPAPSPTTPRSAPRPSS